jgi:hypothetical protein
MRRAARIVLAITAAATTLTILGTATQPAQAASTASGAAPLLEYINDSANGRLWNMYSLSQAASGPPVIGDPSAITYAPTGTIHIYARAANNNLYEFVNDGGGGRTWNAYNLTTASSGPGLIGNPSAITYAPTGAVHIYGRASNNDLYEYVNDSGGGRLWNAYDLTSAGGGYAMLGSPSVVLNNSGSTIELFVRTGGGSVSTSNRLQEIVNNGQNGRIWNAYDLTSLANSQAIASDPSAILYPQGSTSTQVYARGANGNIMQFVAGSGTSWSAYDLTAASGSPTTYGDPSVQVVGSTVYLFSRNAASGLAEITNNGVGGRLWNPYDLSSLANGTKMLGDPSAQFFPATGTVHVYVRSTANDLVEFVDDNAGGHAWNAYDLSAFSQGYPVTSNPSAVYFSATQTIHIYASGPPPPGVPPPTGVGVYGPASEQAALTALQEGWRILGDTGGLGTAGPPYTTPLIATPDANFSAAIAQTGVRTTWLSFWTVSGPVGADSWYTAGYDGGQVAASTIAAGVVPGVNPDYVILDAEGYNGVPTSAATWSSFVSGWAAGVLAVDPALVPAYYADQSQVQSYGLAALPYPGFIAIEPITGNTPYVSGGNILGYIAVVNASYGDTTGGCPAAPYESRILNWGAAYNTMQFPDSGVDCGP